MASDCLLFEFVPHDVGVVSLVSSLGLQANFQFRWRLSAASSDPSSAATSRSRSRSVGQLIRLVYRKLALDPALFVLTLRLAPALLARAPPALTEQLSDSIDCVELFSTLGSPKSIRFAYKLLRMQDLKQPQYVPAPDPVPLAVVKRRAASSNSGRIQLANPVADPADSGDAVEWEEFQSDSRSDSVATQSDAARARKRFLIEQLYNVAKEFNESDAAIHAVIGKQDHEWTNSSSALNQVYKKSKTSNSLSSHSRAPFNIAATLPELPNSAALDGSAMFSSSSSPLFSSLTSSDPFFHSLPPDSTDSLPFFSDSSHFDVNLPFASSAIDSASAGQDGLADWIDSIERELSQAERGKELVEEEIIQSSETLFK